MLRATQGISVAAAFGLTMTSIAQRGGPEATASPLAADVTGVVASNLVGRLVASAVGDVLGLSANLAEFACLNLAGAVLIADCLKPPMSSRRTAAAADPACRAEPALSTPGLKSPSAWAS